ncbi:MAG: GDP-mannose 4,6-dehydratase [Nitrososphaeria archaeon]
MSRLLRAKLWMDVLRPMGILRDEGGRGEGAMRNASEMKLNGIYHLAAHYFVTYSFANQSATYDTKVGNTLNVVNAIKDYSPRTRLYFIASSGMFGRSEMLLENGRV